MVATLAALAVLLASGEVAQEVVGQVRVGSRDVSVSYRQDQLPALPATYVQVGEWRYALDSAGSPRHRFLGQGGWSEVAALYQQHAAKLDQAPEWRVKVVVASRQTVLNVDAQNVATLRRGTIMDEEIAGVYRGLAQAKVALEAYSLGLVRVRFDVEIDGEPVYFVEGDADFDALIAAPVRGKVSTGEFVAEDKVFRGPYQSLWVVHTPVLQRQSGEWPSPIRFAAGDGPDGFQLNYGDYIRSFLRDVERHSKRIGLDVVLLGERDSWSEPLASLGLLMRFEDWRELCDDRFVPGPWRFSSRTSVEWRSAARPLADVARTDSPGTHRLELIELFQSKDLGQVAALGSPAWTFSLPDGVSVGDLVGGLERRTAPSSPVPPFRILQGMASGEQGGVFEAFRTGPGAFAIALPEGPPSARSLRFRFETSVADAFGVAIERGGRERYVHLVGTVAQASGAQFPSPHLAQLSSQTGTPTNVEIPLDGLELPGDGPYRARIVSEPNSDLFQRASLPLMRLRLWPVDWSAEAGEGTVAKPEPPMWTPNATSENWYERCLAAVAATDAATLLPLLGDPNENVVLNAVRTLARLDAPEGEARLGDLSLSSDVVTAEYALRALAKMNKPSSWLLVRKALDGSPYDRSRAVAAELLGSTKNSIYAGPIMLLSALGWRSRLAATEALGHLEGDVAPTVHMAMFIDPDPWVRVRTAQVADAKPSLVRQRLRFYAVNDPSDAVRAACCVRMIQSGDAELAQDGYKGLRDDSKGTRLAIVEALDQNPHAEHLRWLLLAAGDAVVEVRITALKALEDEVYRPEPADLARLLTERNGRVQEHVLDLIAKKGARFEREQLSGFLASPNPAVAARARAMLGTG